MKRQVFKLKDTAQTDYTTLDPQNLHLFVDESGESGVVPDASPTVKGISKLYNDLLDSNIDGGLTQAALVEALSLKLNKTVAATGTVISFAIPQIYNTASSPASGNITNNLTRAQIGIVQKIYHNSGTAPTFPAGWVKIGTGTYTPSTLNVIFAEWSGGSRVEYWIITYP